MISEAVSKETMQLLPGSLKILVLHVLLLRTLPLGTQAPCCEEVQVTQRGHVEVLQSTFPTEPSLGVIPTQVPDG